MEFNTVLFNLVDNIPNVYWSLWDKWKQINPGTHIEFVNTFTVRVATDTHMVRPAIYFMEDTAGIKPAIYRIAGNLLKSKTLSDRGKHAPPPNLVNVTDVELRLESWGFTDQLNGNRQFYMQYHPASDTLFVYKLNRG